MTKMNLGLKKDMIVLDDIETWDECFIAHLKNNKATIFSYINEELSIDSRAIEYYALRIDRPKNKFQSDWETVISLSNQIISSSKIIGFHCTRLTKLEIDSIRENGLDILNTELFMNRISQLKETNQITETIFEVLLNNNCVDDENRRGRLWFVHNRMTLTNEMGFYRLFKRWGGESLYWQHEGESMCNSVLKSIGIPCIVLGLLTPQDIERFMTFGERMIQFWRDSFNSNPYSHDTDTPAKRKIEVFKIITIHDPLFNQLTGFKKWKKKIY